MDRDACRTTISWNHVPPEPLPRHLDFAAALPSSRLGATGIARMRWMLDRFVSAVPGEEVPAASIADIHGNVEGLRRELTVCRQRGIKNLVCTGDIVDRDPHSVQSVHELQAAQAAFELTVNLGNHDLFFLRAMGGSRRDLITWLGNGGLAVLGEQEVALGELVTEIGRRAQGGGLAPLLWARHILPGDAEMLGRIQTAVRDNECLQSLAAWMRRTMHLSYLSETGVLYVHAGIPTDREGRHALTYESGGRTYRGLWALAKVEEELFAALENGLLAHPSFQFLEHADSPVWIRDWENDSEVDRAQCERLLDSLGVSGIVVGHTVQPSTKGIQEGRLIFADRGLARAYRDQPGIVLIEPGSGIRCMTTTNRELSDRDSFARRIERARFHAREVLMTCPEDWDDTPSMRIP